MKIKVMSFNLRHPVQGDGINFFPNREPKIASAIQEAAPDLIGFQEATEYSRSFLQKTLSDYVVLGCGRESNYSGESCSIAFRKDRFELISLETKWLSTAPDTVNSFYEGSDQSKYPRVYVHAQLFAPEEGERLHFYNAHLDHKGAMARVLGMTQILQSISSCDAPFVLTGDMNARPDDMAVQLPLKLSCKTVKDATASLSHTFHGFGRYEEGIKIDYIYTDADFSQTYAVEDRPKDGVYISDHFPICTTIEL
ncbi:MAG: endonuclease/exonuclease/phosphatase family protein [Clostridia bacterium]|nr:endonuclease/exonuclease/phosphatase family protein [Clostridia bacterium]